MSKVINRAELVRHLERMDGRAKGDVDLYRHLMSKDEESSKVEGNSYRLGTGYSDVIKGLQGERHQYVTLALFNNKDKRKKTTIKATSGVYVDLDDALFGGKIGLDLIHYSLEQARIGEPSLTIHTGGGWHLYWLFNDLYYINGDEDIKRYEEVITSIIDSLSIIGADPRAKDVTRLLRLAGSYNPKYDSSPAVMIVESNDLYYNIEDFDGLRVVKKIHNSYHQSNKKEVKKSILTAKEEPAANKKSQVKKEASKSILTRPDEEFTLDLLPEILVDAQIELERRNKSARYMGDVNQSVIEDLLLNYIGLPRNRFIFDDGSVGQYVQEGSRNHYLWMLSRRGVTYKHLDIINRTMLLPSLSHNEFMNAVNVWRTMGGIPKISSMVSDLGLTLAEQSVMMTLRLDYEKILDNHEKTIETRIDQVITEGQINYILENPNKTSKELSVETGLTVRRVNQVIKQKGGGDFMTREERIQEMSNIRRDVKRTGRVAIEELLADYQLAEEVLDRIIKNQTLIYNLRVPLTSEQLEEIKERAESLSAKVAFITSQIEAYESFIVDESEYFKSGKIKKSVLLDKLNVLKESTGRLVTV